MWSKKIKGLMNGIVVVLISIIVCSEFVYALPVTTEQTNEQQKTSEQVEGKQEKESDRNKKQYVHTQGFLKDHSLTGLFSQCSEYFTVDEWDIKEATFDMVYNVSQLRDKKLSDFTISLNGEPFYSKHFDDKTGETKHITIKLPIELIKVGVNELKIESYIRTKESLPCADDVAKANWFHISKDSAISISYIPNQTVKTIADLYQTITAIYAMENKKSALILSDEPSNEDMTIAGNILTGMAKNINLDYQNFALVRANDIFEEKNRFNIEYGIYIGELYSLPTAIFDTLSEEARKEAQEGAVLEFISVRNMDLLVLTGTNEELLLKAGTMFGNADYMKQMTDSIHRITKDENPVMEKKEQLEYSNLTEEGAYVNGAFRQTFSFTKSSYANKQLAPTSELYLKVRYSKNLDFKRSLLTVYINDVPIGSHKLSKEKANGDEVNLYIPSDLKVSGDFTIKVAFDLELEDEWCTLRQEEMPWAYISPESMMKLVLTEELPLLLEYYPAPFIKNKSLNNILFALPEKTSSVDLNIFKNICLTLGKFEEDNTGSLVVKQGATKKDCEDKNVIVIGTFANNEIVQTVNKDLYFQFDQNGTRILSNEKKQITEEAGKELGIIQLMQSPFGEKNRGILFVTGATEQGMLSVAEYLSDTEKLWQVTGDGCVANEEELFTYQFKKDKNKMITTTKELVKRDDVLRLLVVSISVAVILIIGLVFIIVKHFKRRKNTRNTPVKKEDK